MSILNRVHSWVLFVLNDWISSPGGEKVNIKNQFLKINLLFFGQRKPNLWLFGFIFTPRKQTFGLKILPSSAKNSTLAIVAKRVLTNISGEHCKDFGKALLQWEKGVSAFWEEFGTEVQLFWIQKEHALALKKISNCVFDKFLKKRASYLIVLLSKKMSWLKALGTNLPVSFD